jgi:sterol desaturase/sphingolipid hydroxylase (fatty acid hydroxylase superfamily)
MSLILSPPASRRAPWAVTWLTWPLLLAVNLFAVGHALSLHWNLGLTLGLLTVFGIAVLVTLEWRYPLDPRWRMSRRTFLGRDLKFFIAGAFTGAGSNLLFGLLGLSLAGHPGPLSQAPLWLQIPAAVLAFDFCQYWQHRWSHEAKGPVKSFLWKAHVAHHLPEQVYVLMHPAMHPINFLLVQGVIRVPLFFFLGISPEAIFAATALIGLQSLVSHCNVDLRAGGWNYLFVGTELHRFHHSAAREDTGNFAVVLSFLDVLFGTFVYRPGEAPQRLGVEEPARYPKSHEFWRIMRIPFRAGR